MFLILDQSLNLDTLLINLRHLAPKWQEIGIHLKISAAELKSIQELCKEVDFDCLVELFDKWLRSTDAPTWKNITDALDTMGEYESSQNIMDMLSKGDCGYNLNLFPLKYVAYDTNKLCLLVSFLSF